jgi:flavin-dependent dehydrogenase
MHTRSRQCTELQARILIAAHGSSEKGPLFAQRLPRRAGDLFGFKAHFQGGDLSADLMPLLLFAGGYGGMVTADRGRISLSCCIRRDQLNALRAQAPGLGAGEAVERHIEVSCVGAREVLARARRDGDWLSAGPIRPGVRVDAAAGSFSVGNAAGEAHPIIADGISMALQSARLLCEQLTARGAPALADAALAAAAADYARRWRENFGTRVAAATLFAQLAQRPTAVLALRPLLRAFPTLLTLGARFAGKAGAQPVPAPPL